MDIIRQNADSVQKGIQQIVQARVQKGRSRLKSLRIEKHIDQFHAMLTFIYNFTYIFFLEICENRLLLSSQKIQNEINLTELKAKNEMETLYFAFYTNTTIHFSCFLLNQCVPQRRFFFLPKKTVYCTMFLVRVAEASTQGLGMLLLCMQNEIHALRVQVRALLHYYTHGNITYKRING